MMDLLSSLGMKGGGGETPILVREQLCLPNPTQYVSTPFFI